MSNLTGSDTKLNEDVTGMSCLSGVETKFTGVAMYFMGVVCPDAESLVNKLDVVVMVIGIGVLLSGGDFNLAAVSGADTCGVMFVIFVCF